MQDAGTAGRPPPRAPLALVLWGDWAMGLLASKLAFFLAAGTPEAAARAPPGSLRARLGALRERVRIPAARVSSSSVARTKPVALRPPQGWTRAPFWPTLTGVLLLPTAAAAAALAAPAAALRLLPLLPGGGPRLPGGAREHAWLAEAVLVGAAVGALRARAALAAWVARVHAERCGPARTAAPPGGLGCARAAPRGQPLRAGGAGGLAPSHAVAAALSLAPAQRDVHGIQVLTGLAELGADPV